MKTFAHALLATLLLSTATFASTATTTPATPANPTVTTDSYKVAIFPAAAQSKLHIYVERNPGQMMFVSLKSANGKILGKQMVNKKQGNFHFQFDLTDLQDGTYSVEVLSGKDVTIYPVTLATQQAQALARHITLN